MKQSTWLRTVLCGGWCLRMALCTPSGACQRRRRLLNRDSEWSCTDCKAASRRRWNLERQTDKRLKDDGLLVTLLTDDSRLVLSLQHRADHHHHQSTQRYSNTQETSGLSTLPSNTHSSSLPAFKRRFTSNVDCVNWLKCCCFGSRPSDHYFRSVCWFVCLFVQSFSQPSLIRFRSNYDIYYMSGSSCVP